MKFHIPQQLDERNYMQMPLNQVYPMNWERSEWQFIEKKTNRMTSFMWYVFLLSSVHFNRCKNAIVISEIPIFLWVKTSTTERARPKVTKSVTKSAWAMQNPNAPGSAGLSLNRSQAALFETLQARSLSPNVQIMQNYQETYPNEQFYHSMPHVSTANDRFKTYSSCSTAGNMENYDGKTGLTLEKLL